MQTSSEHVEACREVVLAISLPWRVRASPPPPPRITPFQVQCARSPPVESAQRKHGSDSAKIIQKGQRQHHDNQATLGAAEQQLEMYNDVFMASPGHAASACVPFVVEVENNEAAYDKLTKVSDDVGAWRDQQK
jgi:hypothetical protein